MKNKLNYLLTLLILCSCSRNSWDRNYKGEPNYSNFYIVDTIKVIDPVRIHSPKFGGQFIVSRAILNQYNNKIGFFTRPDVFLLGDDLYRYLPQNEYKRHSYKDYGGCDFKKSSLLVQGIEVYELKGKSISFLLGLINANFYHLKNNSYNYFAYPIQNDKKSFYKIVFPLCK